MTTAEIKIDDEIMATSLHIKLCSGSLPKTKLQEDINSCISYLKNFELNFSRFINHNELNMLNDSTEVKPSAELLDMLKISKKFHESTNGLFNPAILPALINEGYSVSKKSGYISNNAKLKDVEYDFSKLIIAGNTVFKPLNMKIDLGGIGKGYAADQLVHKLMGSYTDFCVNLGGDLYCAGSDTDTSYDYWPVSVDTSLASEADLPILMIKNKAVATSGTDKRTWAKGKHHLIDPQTQLSSSSDIITATVISDTVVTSDILAKILLLMGLEKAINYCDHYKLAGIFMDSGGHIIYSREGKKYVWSN